MTATNARAAFRSSALLVLALGVLFGLLFGSFNYHRDTLNGMSLQKAAAPPRLSHAPATPLRAGSAFVELEIPYRPGEVSV